MLSIVSLDQRLRNYDDLVMTVKREPALLYMSLVAPLCQLVLILWPGLPTGAQSIISGVIPAIVGVLVAFLVRSEKLVPVFVGLAQSVLAAMLANGVILTSDQQTAIMGFVSLAAGLIIRDRVYAATPPTVTPELTVNTAVVHPR